MRSSPEKRFFSKLRSCRGGFSKEKISKCSLTWRGASISVRPERYWNVAKYLPETLTYGTQNHARKPSDVRGAVEAMNGKTRSLLRRGRGYNNFRYLLPKAQRLAESTSEFAAFRKAVKQSGHRNLAERSLLYGRKPSNHSGNPECLNQRWRWGSTGPLRRVRNGLVSRELIAAVHLILCGSRCLSFCNVAP